MAIAFNKFNSFVEALSEGKHNLGSDTLKVMLTNTAPDAADAVKTDITEIATTDNGYSAGGHQATQSASSQTSGTYKLVLNDVTVTQSGANDVGPFRYIVLYNDTAASDELIGWFDYTTTITLVSGASVTFDFDATNGALTLA